MPWVFRFPAAEGSSTVDVSLDSLPWRDLQALAKKHSDVAPSWLSYKDFPLAIAATDLDAFSALRELAAKSAGLEVAPLGDTAADAEKAMAELVEVDDDRPANWEDGNPLTDAQATN